MRELDFSDGFESSTAPSIGSLVSSGFKVFASDAAFVADKGSAATIGDAYFNSTSNLIREFNSTVWVEVLSSIDPQVVTFKDINGGTASNTSRFTVPKNTTANLNALTRKEATVVYDTTTQELKIDDGATLTAIGSGGVGVNQALGVGNGVITSFGPLSFVPSSEESIEVYANGLLVDESEWSLVGLDIVFPIPPPIAQKIYVFFLAEGTSTLIASTGNQKVEYRTLSGGEAAAKSLTLAFTPLTASTVLVDVIGVTAQIYGVDYIVTGAVLSWTGLGMDALPLSAGDILRIVYLS